MIISQDGGQSIAVLASIQSGYSHGTGARCNEIEGYYTDEEISIQAQGVLSWIREEVTQLMGFENMFKFDRQSSYTQIVSNSFIPKKQGFVGKGIDNLDFTNLSKQFLSDWAQKLPSKNKLSHYSLKQKIVSSLC